MENREVGYWVDNDDYLTTSYDTLHIYTCSICKADVTIEEYDSFCHNCGAKMDGVRNE